MCNYYEQEFDCSCCHLRGEIPYQTQANEASLSLPLGRPQQENEYI
jgi:hypothetical protein